MLDPLLPFRIDGRHDFAQESADGRGTRMAEHELRRPVPMEDLARRRGHHDRIRIFSEN
jgi:hypothetical protein